MTTEEEKVLAQQMVEACLRKLHGPVLDLRWKFFRITEEKTPAASNCRRFVTCGEVEDHNLRVVAEVEIMNGKPEAVPVLNYCWGNSNNPSGIYVFQWVNGEPCPFLPGFVRERP